MATLIMLALALALALELFEVELIIIMPIYGGTATVVPSLVVSPASAPARLNVPGGKRKKISVNVSDQSNVISRNLSRVLLRDSSL